MKDNHQLTRYLNEYIKMIKPQFAVMITGTWGCGKTYYIKKLIEEWSESDGKSKSDIIDLKPIYISVNGLNTVSAVVHKVKTILYPLLYSKGAKVAKQALLSLLKIATKSEVDVDGDGVGEDLNSLLDAEGILEIFKSDSAKIKGERVLVFDDLERCKIPLDEFFGFVNGIVEHSDSKVILVCDETRLRASAEKDALKYDYDDFKEKLVGQTFSLEVDYAGMAELFIHSTKNKKLIDNKDVIVSLFVASKCENLRLIKHCLIDIDRFFNQLPETIKKNPNYDAFVLNVLSYLVIASLEDRFGNKDIEKYQSYSLMDEDKKANQSLDSKYYSVLERYHLYSSVYSIPIKNLLAFIRTGYIESPERLVAGCKILQVRDLADWEKLWRCDKLTNEEFLLLLKKVKDRFYAKKIEYAFEVVHLAGILLSLQKRGLVKLSRSYVVKIAKSNANNIYKAYHDDLSRLFMDNRGYEFKESDSPEMKEIFTCVADLRQKTVDKIEKEYIKKVWNNLGSDSTCDVLFDGFNQMTPTRRCKYSDECIFKQISPRIIASKIVTLSNVAKNEFARFIIGRYYLPESGINTTIRDEMKADKTNLMKISAMLKTSSKRMKLLDKEKTLLIATKIDEAVAKI